MESVRRSGTALLRTYFVRGHRVQGTHDGSRFTSWTCDCAEYLHSKSCGEPWCEHADRVLGARGLTLSPDGC